MRVKTLIATTDAAYTGHISEYISEHHADIIEISVCNTVEQLRKTLTARKYDVALMDESLSMEADLDAICMPMLLWAGQGAATAPVSTRCIKKHRRISTTVADVLEQYATVMGNVSVSGERVGQITAVWSPSGGVGKTTVALAYAASVAAKENEVFYLNLESFSAASAYLPAKGKSISTVFEMLETDEGNIKMLVQGICSFDSGIRYLCAPENFEDVSILSEDNISELISSCAEITDELVIDLSSVCDQNTRQAFALADKVLLVTDSTNTAKTKLEQFTMQSNVYEGIIEKITLVVNKCDLPTEGEYTAIPGDIAAKPTIFLPQVQRADAQFVYKELAKCDFSQ